MPRSGEDTRTRLQTWRHAGTDAWRDCGLDKHTLSEEGRCRMCRASCAARLRLNASRCLSQILTLEVLLPAAGLTNFTPSASTGFCFGEPRNVLRTLTFRSEPAHARHQEYHISARTAGRPRKKPLGFQIRLGFRHGFGLRTSVEAKDTAPTDDGCGANGCGF